MVKNSHLGEGGGLSSTSGMSALVLVSGAGSLVGSCVCEVAA